MLVTIPRSNGSMIIHGAVSFVSVLLISAVMAQKAPEELRCKIIEQNGSVKLWSKAESKMNDFNECGDLTSGKTLKLEKDASLHVTFEPLIDFFVNDETTIGFDNLLINRSNGTIRMHSTLEQGNCKLKAPPQPGHTLLFTLRTPAATVDISAAELELNVAKNGETTVKIFHGAAKVLPQGGTIKTVLHRGNKGVILPKQPDVHISTLADTGDVKARKVPMKQPSIAILSVKSKTTSNDNLEHISNSVARELEKSGKAKVLFLEDIKKLLHDEGLDRLLNCFTDSCISKIGSHAGVDIVIVGNLGKLGSTHVLDLKMVDVLRDKMLKRTSVSVKEDLGLILNKIPNAIEDLVQEDTMITNVVEGPPSSGGGSPEEYREKVVWIFPGSFKMGSGGKSGEIDELPRHTVKLDGFFIDRFEVTKQEFKTVMGYNPTSSKGCDNCPVTNVTWKEASDFCKKAGKELPTEAQWEYAARARSKTPFATGVTITAEQANFNAQQPFEGSPVGPFRGKVVPVGSFPANNWNLLDMHGNAAEWCTDWYDANYYGNSPDTNPEGPEKGKLKVVRGGHWKSEGSALRSANRMAYNPELRLSTIGFRCVKNEKDKK